jgi:hypothetical protein
VYNRYRRLNGDQDHVPGGEDVRAVFGPLFLASWLIEMMFRRENWFGAERLIVTSASSKTAMALAHVARAALPDIGRNRADVGAQYRFRRGDEAVRPGVGYGELAGFGPGSAVSVDFAGNGATLAGLHVAVGDDLRYSCLVGVADW